MCNCVRKCVSFPRISTVHCHFAVNRFTGDSRAKSPLPSHKKAPERDSTTFIKSCYRLISREADDLSLRVHGRAERRQERRFPGPMRAAGRSRTRG
jgi:hypothetical protein